MLKWLTDRYDLWLNGYTADDAVSLVEKLSEPRLMTEVFVSERESKAFHDLIRIDRGKLRKLCPTIANMMYG